jgi:multidrug efflux pump subunit AcrB
MKIVETSIKYRTVVFALAVVGMFWGFMAYNAAPRREEPEFVIRVSTISVKWPGATTQQMEELVCSPLERIVSEIDEVKETITTINPGICTIKVEMEDYVDNADEVCDKIRAQVKKVPLPVGVSEPFVNSNFADTCVLLLALYQIPEEGENTITKPYSMRQLEIFCEEIRDNLKQLKTVATVNIMSAQQEAIYIEPDAGSWSRIQVPIAELSKRLNEKNKLVSGGMLDTGEEFLNVSIKGDYNLVSQIRRTVAAESKGKMPIRLDSLGLKVKRSYVDPPALVTRYSNDKIHSQDCIVMYFTMKKQQNIVALGEAVSKRIKQWEKTFLPPNVKVAIVSNQPLTVSENINVFVSNLFQAIIILLLVAWLLIGKRVAIIMGCSIPVIVMTSFAIVRCFGVELEKMSIASLIISLGMLVDCAVEICDNVHRLQEEGYSRFDAAVKGSKQVIFPILIGTLTTVFAFLPMLTIPGNAGEYIRSIPIVVPVTLLVSWVVAITFTVTLTWRILKPGTDKVPPLTQLLNFFKGKKSTEPPKEKQTNMWYKSMLQWSMKNRITIIAGAFALFLFSIFLLYSGVINLDFIPTSSGKLFLVDIWLPEGASVKKTSKVCKQVESIILQEAKELETKTGKKYLNNTLSFVGESIPRITLSILIEFPKSNYAQVLVTGENAKNNDALMKRLNKKFMKNVPQARIVCKKIGMGPVEKYPVNIRLLGDDYIILKKYAAKVMKILRKIPGTVDVHDGWGNLAVQVNIEPDGQKCGAAGVSRTAIANTLNAFLSGSLLTTFREGDHLVPVYFRLPYSERSKLNKLKELYVEGSHGKVPLSSVVKTRLVFLPNRIERYHQQRNMEVQAQVADGFLATAIIQKALPELKKLNKKLPANYTIEIGGTYDKTKEISGDMANATLIAFILIVLCLLFYFNSMLKTFAVLLTLPLACTGALFGLLIMNQPLGFFAQLGLLSLFGIVVNGAIVLFDFISMLVHEKAKTPSPNGLARYKGLTRKEFIACVIEGGQLRLRPIFLTTFTTVGGLLPLAFFGGPLFEPLAVVIIFGLLYSTSLTLLLMPVIYSICVEKFGMKIATTESVDQL